MRTAIKTKLTEELPAIAGRCYDAHEPTASTVKPFVAVKLAGETAKSGWTGRRRRFEVAVYGEPASLAAVEQLAEQAVQALNRIRLTDGDTGTDFSCVYSGMVGPDGYDDGMDALVRILAFDVMAVYADETPSGISGDPWLEALCAWTAALVGPDWDVYRQHWPQGYRRPSILWRLERLKSGRALCSSAPRGGATGGPDLSHPADSRSEFLPELRKTFAGHVLGRSEAEQLAMIERLAVELGRMTKLGIDAVERRYAIPDAVAADVGADAFETGQLSVAFRQPLGRMEPTGPLIAGVHYGGGIR